MYSGLDKYKIFVGNLVPVEFIPICSMLYELVGTLLQLTWEGFALTYKEVNRSSC